MTQLAIFPVAVVDRLRSKFRLRILEWVTSCVLTTWGFMLASRPEMFDSAFYAGLNWAPQSDWAAVAMALGFARLSALIVNGSWRYSNHVRAVLAAASVFVWGGLVEGIWAFGQPTLGMAICPWLLLADFAGAWWASGDARDGTHRMIKPATRP